MRHTHLGPLAALAVLAVAGSAAASGGEFGAPASLEGSSSVSGTQALLLLFGGGDPAIQLNLTAGATYQEQWYTETHWSAEPVNEANVTPPGTSRGPTQGLGRGLQVQLHPRDVSSLFILASRIEVATSGHGTISDAEDGCLLGGLSSAERGANAVLPTEEKCGDAQVPRVRLAGASQVRVEGLRVAEWHNMEVECGQAADCPPEGTRTTTVLVPGNDLGASQTEYRFVRLSADGGSASATGPMGWLGVARSLDLTQQGSVRLPDGDIDLCASACTRATNGTVTLEGNVTMTGLHVVAPGRFASGLSSEGYVAYLDERSLLDLVAHPAVAVGAAVVLGAGALAVAVGLWVRREQAQEPPRRALAFAFVREHPGLSIRALSQGLQVPASTMRFHLGVLQRQRKVVSHGVGRSRRFFENHGRHDADWQAVALLSDPPLRALRDLVGRQAESRQGDLVRMAQEEFGWKRTTVIHRLGRLAALGLVERRTVSRQVVYGPSLGLRP